MVICSSARAISLFRKPHSEEIWPNKALQLTPSRDVPVSYDRSVIPFTLFLELVRPFGVAELGVRSFKL
jgi:hypothetical protein